MQFFTDTSEARRYAESRPYFHPVVIEQISENLGLKAKLALALDVAGGTGQSTRALASIAETVVGIDISRNMLLQAPQEEKVYYAQGRAEAVPLPSGSVSIVTTALAFHWFDRRRFLAEARRVLRDEGWLVIYNNGFSGIMRESAAFQDWSHHDYPARFPTPPRNSQPLTADDAQLAGFELVREDRYENEVAFTPAQLTAYLTTQTNVKAALDEKRESIESASEWILNQVTPFFEQAEATCVFVTRSAYLLKVSNRG